MITITQFLTAYCQERNLPPPQRPDLSGFGKLINHHWRRKFVNIEGIEPGVPIAGAGFIIQQEYGEKVVVIFYPDTPSFLTVMTACANYYYENKSKKSSPPPPRPKKRKRNYIKPEFSAKPSNIQSRTF